MQITCKNGGEWYWLRNDKETDTWKLCAKRMKILPREIIAEVAKYLYDATYYHRACDECMKDAKWLPVVPKGRILWGGLRNAEFECNVKASDCKHQTPLTYPLKTIMVSYAIWPLKQ